MPTYDYRCPQCEHECELTHPIDAEVPRCPHCSAELAKCFTPVPVHFKGAGWYVNDTGGENSAAH